MQNKTITAEQAKQREKLGYVLVKVEPQPKNIEIDKDFIAAFCPFNLNDEVYCEDEQEGWSNDKIFPEGVLIRNISKQFADAFEFPPQPASTMPASLASKSWMVTGIEVVEAWPEGAIDKAINNKFGPTVNKQWHWKIKLKPYS